MADLEAPLRGRRVLITRPEGRGQGLASAVERLGGVADLRPTIAFAEPETPGPAREAADHLDDYHWVVVTSPTGVHHLVSALAGRDLGSLTPRFAAVGPGTARALGAAGIPVEIVAARADADGLAADLVPRVQAGQRVLVVRPEVARPVLPDALRARGASVDAVVFYRTVAAPGCSAIAQDLIDRVYDIVVFSSPSTLSRLLDDDAHPGSDVVAALAGTRRVAIGEVTARALADQGIAAHAVAHAPTEDGVVDAIRASM